MRNEKTTEKDLMFKELKKDSNGFVFRSSPKQVNKSTQYSSFWMNDENDEYNELFGITEDKGNNIEILVIIKGKNIDPDPY